MCKHGKKCKRKSSCNFAHSKDELQIIECVFGKNCRRKDCYYNHSFGRYIDKKYERKVGKQLDDFMITKQSRHKKK